MLMMVVKSCPSFLLSIVGSLSKNDEGLYSCIDMCRQMNLQLLCIPPVAAESAWALVARRSTSPVSQITRGCSGS